MAKSRLSDLNNHLFSILEDLVDPTDDDGNVKSSEEIEKEVKRANAVIGVSQVIIENANMQLNAMKFQAKCKDYGLKVDMPDVFALPGKTLTGIEDK